MNEHRPAEDHTAPRGGDDVDRHDTVGGHLPASARRPSATLLTGDAVDVLSSLPADSVHCVVTSPPYWRLRDYGTGHWAGGNPRCPHQDNSRTRHSASECGGRQCARCGATFIDGQYGIEATSDAYIKHIRAVFSELRRILAPAGTVWLNMGDSYSANSDGYWCAQPGQYRQPRYRPLADVPHKNLIGMPWRVGLALQEDGWILRNAIVWHKPNAAPLPVRDRVTNRHELIFLLVRQPRYFFDLDPIRLPYTGDRPLSRRAHRGGNKLHTARGTWPPPDADGPLGVPVRARNPGNVWTIPVTPDRHRRHPAPFPVEIPLRCIAAGCPRGGHVLDPFSGSGTTGQAALQLGRSYTGIDLDPVSTAMADKRLRAVAVGGGRVRSPRRSPETP